MVKFTNSKSASSPTLNVNSTGAKPIYRYGTTKASTSTTVSGWTAGAVQMFTYDGTGWIRDYWSNTTYSTFKASGTDAASGLVPKPSTTAGTTKFLREDATWATPTAEDVGAMPATGGTFSNWAHRIEKSDVAGRNVSARDRAIIRTTTGHETSYCCGASLKTVEGTWDIGTRNNDLIIQYATDANFNAGTNTVLTGFRVTDEGAIVVGAGSYGDTLPTGGVAGQIFFKI